MDRLVESIYKCMYVCMCVLYICKYIYVLYVCTE